MYLGLDLGTSGLKALLIGADQEILAEAQSALDVARPQAGWAEQDPADWIAACDEVMAVLSSQQDLSGLRGIGLSGQMHGAVLLGADDQVLRPAILWNDTRAHAEAAQMDADPQFRAISGNIVFPGFTAPKLAWLRRHEPALWGQVAKVLLPKDYLRLYLTGCFVSDMSDASGTSWFETGARDWSDALLAATGLSRDHMPTLVEGSAPSGDLRASLAQRWGVSAPCVVAGGGGDNAASAVGVGVTAPGQAFVSLGTSGVLFAASDMYHPAPETAIHSFCHCLPQTWHQMGVILSATDALGWYGRFVGQGAAALTGALGDLRPPSKPVFLPYLGGERTPLNDAHVRGAFAGLEHASDVAAGTQAVLEGVSFAIKDCALALQTTGTQIRQLLAVGGGSKSRYWCAAIATVLGVPVSRPVAGDYGGALGAARLAQMAVTGDIQSALQPPELRDTIDPDPALTTAFQQGFERFKRAQRALQAADL